MTDDRNMHEADDARLDALIVREARADRTPPPTPRAEMWTEIRARLDAERATGAPAEGVLAFPAPRAPWTRHIPWGLVAAGTLIVGVGIGRLTRPDDAAAPTPQFAAPVIASTSTAPVTAPSPDTTPAAVSSSAATSVAAVSTPRSDERAFDRPAPRGDDARASTSRSFSAAATVHLAAAEALLTSFRASGDAVASDTAVAAWAGDLLGTTRMLLDSPATRDPKTKRLLEDLELVLAQMARLRPHAPASGRGVDDHDLIDQAIRQRQMLTRLRAAGA